MKLAFFSVVLNHHQAPLAEEFYKILGKDYIFIETTNLGDNKGAMKDYSSRPYLLRAWESPENYQRAMRISTSAEVCVFGGDDCFVFLKERMKVGLLSFQVGERWLKRGIINLLSPRLLRYLKFYHLYNWKRKPLYKLCASAFTSQDDRLLHMFVDRSFKWGYFTELKSSPNRHKYDCKLIKFMWCARFLVLKHPELPILMAQRLKELGYKFVLDMYGDGVEFENSTKLVKSLNLENYVVFKGNVPNSEILNAMCEHDIFLFTSDSHEGWGAVMNEAMSCGCIPVGSDAIGSVPYLINNRVNGMIFKSLDLKSLVSQVKLIIDYPSNCINMSNKAYETIHNEWSPEIAASRLLQLIQSLEENKNTTFLSGPCSMA